VCQSVTNSIEQHPPNKNGDTVTKTKQILGEDGIVTSALKLAESFSRYGNEHAHGVNRGLLVQLPDLLQVVTGEALEL
jgi:hypothetical protein